MFIYLQSTSRTWKLKSQNLIRLTATSLAFILWLQLWKTWGDHELRRSQHPRLRQTIFEGSGIGGRWHIPVKWLNESVELPKDLTRSPNTTLEAALLAFYLARSQSRYIANSSIPLILHQSWYSMTEVNWSPLLKDSVESWLSVCAGEPPMVKGAAQWKGDDADMAYIIWDDDGMDSFMKEYESEIWESYISLPIIVERADVFRVAVLRWFGGVYSDIDTIPLRHPVSWVEPLDIEPWEDSAGNRTYSLSSASDIEIYSPTSKGSDFYSTLYERSSGTALRFGNSPNVGAIVGIEADISPDSDMYWRSGYEYPLQITQWSLALAPHHPISARYISSVDVDVKTLQRENRLHDVYAVDLTGPVQFTKVIKEWLELVASLRWNALTGLHDGGKSKTVTDVLILPITGFSPGRATDINVGSKPITDQSARLLHRFQGSWRGKLDLVTEYGKLCRKLFGKCRAWRKDSNKYY
ncbi:hypothetical protein V1517DRAFT_333593 [Lipomyces orientalis]|uniref:Uncharacterized protein n=1 Tax=Lipomyces orientalis TaxID=1233043 RepID=A0ACC3TEN4_9ASCO